MILEIATFDIQEDSIEAFKSACEKAKRIVSQTNGFRGLEFQQCIESRTKFVALISWATLEDHTVGFRESELFKEWRAVLKPYFRNQPVAEHFECVTQI
jgi:heme-degrading monooxygenase HmoA